MEILRPAHGTCGFGQFAAPMRKKIEWGASGDFDSHGLLNIVGESKVGEPSGRSGSGQRPWQLGVQVYYGSRM